MRQKKEEKKEGERVDLQVALHKPGHIKCSRAGSSMTSKYSSMIPKGWVRLETKKGNFGIITGYAKKNVKNVKESTHIITCR